MRNTATELRAIRVCPICNSQLQATVRKTRYYNLQYLVLRKGFLAVDDIDLHDHVDGEDDELHVYCKNDHSLLEMHLALREALEGRQS